MRIWHEDLINFLPDAQLRSQWRECALIADALAKKGTPNHLLVNRVTEYPLEDFWVYCESIMHQMKKRKMVVRENTCRKILKNLFAWKCTCCLSPSKYHNAVNWGVFGDWHNKEYLRVCMANLYEKHIFGIGKSRITDEEWTTLCRGYKKITGEDYSI